MPEGGPSRRRLTRLRPWIWPLVAFAMAAVAALVLWGKLRREVWAYYSDGADLRSEIDDGRARPVLWQDPEPHAFEDGDGRAAGTLEAAFSSDGTSMVLVHWGVDGDNADLYRSDWDGRVWSKPEPVKSVNTGDAERSPALSRDGRYLYFASDRQGGAGGYDLYVARWDGRAWGEVEALPRIVNSPANELGPALSPDDAMLYFSSDRAGGEDDIFAAEIKLPAAEDVPEEKKPGRGKDRPSRRRAADLAKARKDHAGPPAPMPRFGFPSSVGDLNSEAADVQAALTTRGDHVFLASNRDGGGEPGFRIYLSRVVGGRALPPEAVDLHLEGGDATDPAVRMEGFDLLFSVGGATRDAPEYRLFRSTTREVVGYTDLSRWEQFKELMDTIKWWILLAIAALMALIYILEKWRDMTSLFHKCLAGSAVVHLLALLLAMVMLIATRIEEDEVPDDQVVEVSIDALAQEELALESIPEETSLTDTTANLESEKEESEFGAPGFEAPGEVQPVPEAATSSKESAVAEPRPAMAAATEEPVTPASEEASVLSELATAALPEIAPVELEERDPAEAVAESATEQFEPAEPVAEAEKVEVEMTEDRAVETPAEVVEIAENQSAEPLAEQSKEAEFVDSQVSESEPLEPEVAAETPPLESEALTSLPESQFVDPNEAAFEELDPATAGADEGPADPAQEMFDPGEAAANLATERSTAGVAAADTATDRPAGAGEVAESSVDVSTPAGDAVAPGIAESGPGMDLPSGGLEPALPDASLVDPGLPVLEEPAAELAGGAADESEDRFDPGAAAPNLATKQAGGSAVADAALTGSGDAIPVPEVDMVVSSAVGGARPSEPAEAGSGAVEAPSLEQGDLPEVALVDLAAPTLEEGGGEAGGPAADASRDRFEPGDAVPKLATIPADGAEGAMESGAAVPNASEAADVATGGMVAGSAVTETRHSEAAASEAATDLPPSEPGTLPAVAVVDPGLPTLEEPGARAGGAPADESAGQFQPGGAVPGLVTSPSGGGAVGDAAVDEEAAGSSIDAARTGGSASAAMPRGDLVAAGTLPDLDHARLSPGLEVPGLLPSPGLPGELEVPPGVGPRGMADVIRKQRGKPGLDTIEQMGGSKGSEEAVGAAMEWLSENQEPDGRWDTRKHGAKQNFDTGGTGLALLCFYGWGERHDVECKYRDKVRGALDWLVEQQDENGYLGGSPGMMYSHAISAIALCEAYGVTKDPSLKKPAEGAIAYTLASQHPQLGGWRYTPGNGADTSVTGWQYMALHSARMAGLEVPEEAFEHARAFLDKTGGGRSGGLYGYQGRTDVSRAMVATGMFCRQLDLVPPSDPKMRESARFLKMNPMKTSKPDLYYVYYATLALYQHQGPVWTAWNERLQETLRVLQKKNGSAAGSWDPSASMTGDGGRVISTCLATLSLEVYYRLLPMYGFRNSEAEAPEPKVRGE